MDFLIKEYDAISANGEAIFLTAEDQLCILMRIRRKYCFVANSAVHKLQRQLVEFLKQLLVTARSIII